MTNDGTLTPQTRWENPVKARIRSGQPAVSITITLDNVDIAAQAAELGFDFLWVEMEHSHISLETLHHMALATRCSKAPVFARVPVNEVWTAKRVLDAGVMGVIFPFTHTAELARQAVEACRYPPVGLRGSGAGLANFCWPQGNYYDLADENVMTIAMIESAAAVENIEAIAATPGLDLLFVGPSDLAFSLGLRGQQGSPKLLKAIDRVIDAAHRHGKFLGRPASDAEQVEQYMEQGFRLFMGPTELDFMAAGAQSMMLGPLGKTCRRGPTLDLP